MQLRQRQLQQPALRVVAGERGLGQFRLDAAGHVGNQGVFRSLQQQLQFLSIGLLLDASPSLQPQQLGLQALQQLLITLVRFEAETAALLEQQELLAGFAFQQGLQLSLQPLQIIGRGEMGP